MERRTLEKSSKENALMMRWSYVRLSIVDLFKVL